MLYSNIKHSQGYRSAHVSEVASVDLSWEHNGQLKVFAELRMSMNDHESEGVSIWG